MTIKRLIQKAFIGGRWYVGYRRKGDTKYSVIETPKDMWIADPTMFTANGEHYLFVEVYENKKKKAAIGYYHFEDDIPVYKGLIIENPYHMSYPCVFEHNGEFYMIPESSANDSITLYKAEHFPDKWVKETDLLKGEKYVDSTVIRRGDDLGLLSYKAIKGRWQLVSFFLDMEQKVLKKENVLDYKENIGRPAGYIFAGNKRPAQDCRKKYGENLLIYEVDSFQPYVEHLTNTVCANQIDTSKPYDRVHTYTDDGTFEVVDLFKEKFDLMHGVKIFCRAYLRK